MVAEGKTINKMESNVVMPRYWEPGMFLTGISDNNAEWLGLKPGIWWGGNRPLCGNKVRRFGFSNIWWRRSPGMHP